MNLGSGKEFKSLQLKINRKSSTCFCLGWKTIIFVLVVLIASLLALSHISSFWSSRFTKFPSSKMLVPFFKAVVSSAKRKLSRALLLNISFMKIKKSSGPKIDPCWYYTKLFIFSLFYSIWKKYRLHIQWKQNCCTQFGQKY